MYLEPRMRGPVDRNIRAACGEGRGDAVGQLRTVGPEEDGDVRAILVCCSRNKYPNV